MRLMTSKADYAAPTLPMKALLLPVLFLTFGLFPAKGRGQENSSSSAQPTPGLYNPVANPKAVVILGHARFTVLTPEMIRMEWSADGKFEDHASFVFLNRDMPVPPFTHTVKHDRTRPGADAEHGCLETNLHVGIEREWQVYCRQLASEFSAGWKRSDVASRHCRRQAICKAQLALWMARGATRRRNRSARDSSPAMDGWWLMTPNGRCSIPPIFNSSRERRARGHGYCRGQPGTIRTGTSLAMGTTTNKRWAIM